MSNAFEKIGAARFEAVLDEGALRQVTELFPTNVQAGKRLSRPEIEPIRHLLNENGAIGSLASKLLSAPAFPVRAVLFDKGSARNWALGPHQDRTIAIVERHDLAGFGPWTVKAGQLHVQPPQRVIEAMVTLRIHTDRVHSQNARLEILPGSHRLGRLTDKAIEVLAKGKASMECLAGPGDVWAYQTAIVHWSRPSQSEGRRRVLQIDYACDDLPPPLLWAFNSTG